MTAVHFDRKRYLRIVRFFAGAVAHFVLWEIVLRRVVGRMLVKAMPGATPDPHSGVEPVQIAVDQLQHLPCAYHDKAQTGDQVQRCTSDVETLRAFLANQIVEIG